MCKKIDMYKKITMIGLSLILAISLVGIAEAVTISFEQSEGFPGVNGNIGGTAIPTGTIVSWTPNPENDDYISSDGVSHNDTVAVILPAGAVLGSSTGSQVLIAASLGYGGNSLEMNLLNGANLSLDSFKWAWGGSGGTFCAADAPSASYGPGGYFSSLFTATYYDLYDEEIATDTFCGGLSSGWAPLLTLAVPTPIIQGIALGKVLFESDPHIGYDPNALVSQGNFFLEDIVLSEISLVGPAGPAGPTGPIGPTGPTGAIGPTGAQGPAGADGLPGADGIDGTNGTNGTNGIDGKDGADGAIGPTGPTGPQGPAGLLDAAGMAKFNSHTHIKGSGSVNTSGPSTQLP